MYLYNSISLHIDETRSGLVCKLTVSLFNEIYKCERISWEKVCNIHKEMSGLSDEQRLDRSCYSHFNREEYKETWLKRLSFSGVLTGCIGRGCECCGRI